LGVQERWSGDGAKNHHSFREGNHGFLIRTQVKNELKPN
jgi:hypothetical protein